MAIKVTCSGCQSVYPVAESLIGKTIRCKKCGEMMPVEASGPAPAAPMAARPVAARPAKPTDDDDEPVRQTRRPARDDDEDDDDAPRSKGKGKGKPPTKKSSLPLILGGVIGVIVLGGGAIGALFATGVIGGSEEKVVAVNGGTNTPPPMMGPPAGMGGMPMGMNNMQPPGPPGPAPTPPAPMNAPTKSEPAQTPAAPPKGGLAPPIALTPMTPLPSPVKPMTPAPVPVPTRDMPDQVTLEKCKAAAVLIKTEDTKGGASTGTGWFGLENGLIFTNAHVIHMIAPGSPKPAKLTIFLNPGTPKEREIPHQRIEILAVDREMDLALLRVLNETELPIPLKTRPSNELRDLEKLIVLGYPGGFRLAERNKSSKPPAVTVNETKVMTLRKDDSGNLYSVQVSGGMVHGNSGGPLVDADGNVTAVAVRVDLDRQGRFTGIAYGVPTEFVTGLIAGRVADVKFGQPYRLGGKVHIPVTVVCLDPMTRLKSVGIAGWVGDESKKSRPSGPERTGMETSDSDYTEVALTYKNDKDGQTATGELVLPDLQPGRAYWAQAYYSNALVTKYWLAGNPIKLSGPPVDREPADLIVRYKNNTRRPLTLSNAVALDEFEEGEGEDRSERLLIEAEINANEQVVNPTEAGAIAMLRLNYDKVKMKGQKGVTSMDDLLPKEFRSLFDQGIKATQGYGLVNKQGEIYKVYSDVRGTAQYAPLFKGLSDDVLESLQVSSIPLPNSKVDPMHKWTATKLVRLNMTLVEPQIAPPSGPGGRPGPAGKPRIKEYRYKQDMTYTYLGSRLRAGTKEAVIKIEGVIGTAPGTAAGSGASGQLKGYAFVDLDTGTVLESDIEKELEVDTSSDGVKKRVSGVNKYKLSRGSTVQ